VVTRLIAFTGRDPDGAAQIGTEEQPDLRES
jgi:hypothetical protein